MWVKWTLVALGLATTSCAGVVGAGAAAVVLTAGYVGFTCYDRVSVTVTDRVTGRKLCDAKVSFFKGDSETVTTSCYEAALTAGKYRLHVERPGLEAFDEPIVVSKGGECGQTIQTMYVALDRVKKEPAGAVPPGTVVLPPVNGTVAPAPSATAPAGGATAPAVPSAAASTAPLPPPPPPPAPPPQTTTAAPVAPPPAASAFPEAPTGAK